MLTQRTAKNHKPASRHRKMPWKMTSILRSGSKAIVGGKQRSHRCAEANALTHGYLHSHKAKVCNKKASLLGKNPHENIVFRHKSRSKTGRLALRNGTNGNAKRHFSHPKTHRFRKRDGAGGYHFRFALHSGRFPARRLSSTAVKKRECRNTPSSAKAQAQRELTTVNYSPRSPAITIIRCIFAI